VTGSGLAAMACATLCGCAAAVWTASSAATTEREMCCFVWSPFRPPEPKPPGSSNKLLTGRPRYPNP
jgi:hypothetical protein